MSIKGICTNRKRGCMKLAAIGLSALFVLGLLLYFLDSQALDEIKHNVSVWTIVALVLIINLVSFLCFIVLYMAWQWVRCDFKAGDKEEELDQ